MCQRCKKSPMGIARQVELEAAREECKQLGVNPALPGSELASEQSAALARYSEAEQDIETLHEEYCYDGLRRAAIRLSA